MARRLELEYVADTSGFSKATREVETSLGRVDKAADRSGNKVKSGLGKAGAAAAGFAGGIAANFAGAALGAITNFAAGSITAASDMNETVSKSRAIFGQQATAVEAWATSGAKNFGLAKSEALGYVASLGDMASQIGFTGKQSAAFGQDLVQVSADLGSFNNLETSDVLDRITAAMRGEYDSLQAIIPNINAARVEQEALTLSGKKATKELTAQDKALAVQAILHKDGAKAMGDFAKTSGGFANQQKIAAAQVQTLQENLGTALLPILVTVMGFITSTAIPAITELAGWFTANLAPAIAEFAGSLSGVLPAIQAFGGFIAQNAKILLPLVGVVLAIVAAVKVWAAVQAVLNVVLAANPIGLVVLAIAGLVAGLVYAYQNSETFRRIVDAAFKGVQTVVEAVINAVGSALGAAVRWLTETWQAAVNFGVRVVKAFQQTNQRVINFVRGLVSAVTGFFTSLVNKSIALVTSLRDRFIRANLALRDGVVRAVTQMRDRVVGFVTSMRDRVYAFVISLRDRVFAAFRALRDGAANIISQARDRVIGRFTSMRDRAVAFTLSLRDRVFSAFRSLRDGMGNIINQARDYLVSRFGAIRDRFSDIARGIRDTVGKIFAGMVDRVRGPLRTLFRFLNRYLINPLSSVTSKFGLTIPSLPTFHKGGPIPGRGETPIMALGGEGVLNQKAMGGIGGKKGLAMLNAGGPAEWLKNFTEFISTPSRLLAEMATRGVKWAIDQVLGAIPAIPSTGSPVMDAFGNVFNSLGSAIRGWAGKREAEQQAELGNGAVGSIGSGPWVKPVGAGIGNGYLGYPGHYGVDMPVGIGTPVHAVGNAIVSKAASLTGSYGRHMFLRHADGLVTVYAHLSSILASVGSQVRAGQVIARSGNSGNSTGPHLHFETRVGGGYPGPNPRNVMRARGVTLDSGGMLPPGLTLVRNATGGPEPVLNPSQWAAVRNGGSSRPNVTIVLNGVIDKAAAAREIRAILRDDANRLSGVTVGRPRA